MKVKDFFDKEFSAFATYSAFRGIANFIDGQKPSSRKVLYCSKSLKDKTKVASLAARIVDSLEYLHGQVSLEGVISNMAQTFAGTNNINLLEPRGDFGSVCIQKAGASRYIYVDKEHNFEKIFHPDDDNILIKQEFEGTKIEPQFYVPIIPMILVNGSEGIGTGFSQKILSRNPLEIINKIESKLTGKGMRQDVKVLLPYFKGFTGRIVKTDVASFDIYGVFVRHNTTTIHVTELPIGYDLQKYNDILTKLEDEKIIVDYIDKSEPKENKFFFEIKVPREFTKKDDDYIIEKLKLLKRVSENYTCIGINNEIVEFKNETEILDNYMEVRLRYYELRKEYLISKVKKELMNIGSKFYFVKFILEDKIKVFKTSKVDIIKQITDNKDFPFYQEDGSFDYLLRMPIHSFSLETIEELKKQIANKKEELKNITDTSLESMWLNDLKELKTKLSKN